MTHLRQREPLKVQVALGAGEAPTSFCSRLAMAVGRTAHDLCLDMGFRLQEVADGAREAIARLAMLGGVEPEQLSSAAFVKTRDARFQMGSQILTKEALSRLSLRICPCCFIRDLEQGSGPVENRPWIRATWMIASVRTCPEHGVGLMLSSSRAAPQFIHDLARRVRPSLSLLEQMGEKTPHRSPSELERYLVARLDGSAAGMAVLDELPLYAAAKLCEVLGAVANHGIRFRAEALTEPEWYRAGHVGFSIASGGESRVREFLSGLQAEFPAGRADWGRRSMFGRFYEWLAHETADKAYDPVREIVRRQMVETLPLGPGDTLFGKPIHERQVHSIHSAARVSATHPRRLRKQLLAQAIIGVEDLPLSDDRVLFPAEKAEALLSELGAAMSLKEAGRYLNAPRPHERLLFERGFIRPVLAGGKGAIKDHAITKMELDRFLSELLSVATPIGADEKGFLQIPKAAKRACCSAMEIVEMVLDRLVPRVRRDPDHNGYLALLVNPKDIVPLVRKSEHGGLSLREVEKLLSTSTKVVKGLIALGHLASETAVNPVNRCPQVIVRAADLRAFMKRYVTLHALAQERGLHFRRLAGKLKAAEVQPAFDPLIVHASFFERERVGKALDPV